MPPCRHCLSFIVALSALPALAAPMPDYVREALARFRTDAPSGWAYTLTTVRNGVKSIERLDRAQPAGKEWTLLWHNRQPPTAKELARYRQEKARNTAPPPPAAFNQEDIDRGSFQLVREDEQRAIVSFRFQEDSADKMLRHLALELVVAKHPPAVEKYELKLLAPFSPVLTVKMLELVAGATFAPAGSPLAGLPLRAFSRFKGRIFFKTIEENLVLIYTHYTRPEP